MLERCFGRNRAAPCIVAKIDRRAADPERILACHPRLWVCSGDIVLKRVAVRKGKLETIIGRGGAIIAHKPIVVGSQPAFAAQVIAIARIFAVIVGNQVLIALQTDPPRRLTTVLKDAPIGSDTAVVIAVEMISHKHTVVAANVE